MQGENRLVCFCKMTQVKASRLLDAQRALAHAEQELQDFRDAIDNDQKPGPKKKSQVKKADPVSGNKGQMESVDDQPQQANKVLCRMFGVPPAPPASLIWGSWLPSTVARAGGSHIDPQHLFYQDPQARVRWPVAGGELPPPKLFLCQHWYAVHRVVPVEHLRKIGTMPLAWFVVPAMDMVGWVNAHLLLDAAWREEQDLAPAKTAGQAQPLPEPSEKSKKSRFGLGFGKENTQNTGPTTAMVNLLSNVVTLLHPICVTRCVPVRRVSC